jgi:hypothetical protein
MTESTSSTQSPSSPTLQDRRWLHDKYERLGEEEGQLAATRTTYFATVGAVLVTGLVLVIINLLDRPPVLVESVTLLATFGILFSAVWAILLHRTTDAQALWREAALRLEELAPPVPTELLAPVTLRSGRTIQVNLAQPYRVHAERFSPRNPISRLDRVNPWTLTEIMPLTFVIVWVVTLVGVWTWFLVY